MGEPFPHGTQAGSGLRLAALGRKPAGCWGTKHIPTEMQPLPGSLQKANCCPQVFLHNGGIREENEQRGP